MSWHIEEDTIVDENETVVCFILPNTDIFYVKLIKKMPRLFELMVDFLDYYERQRKMSKKLYDSFCSLIEVDQNYDFKWHIDINGDIADEEENKICFFPIKNSWNAVKIQYVPEMFKVIQDIVINFNSTSAKQKPGYKNFLHIMNKIDDHN